MKEKRDWMIRTTKYKSNKKKEHIRLVMVSTGVDVVAKTDDEVYVLSIIKIYSYFSFVFYIRLKKIEFLEISKVT